MPPWGSSGRHGDCSTSRGARSGRRGAPRSWYGFRPPERYIDERDSAARAHDLREFPVPFLNRFELENRGIQLRAPQGQCLGFAFGRRDFLLGFVLHLEQSVLFSQRVLFGCDLRFDGLRKRRGELELRNAGGLAMKAERFDTLR